MIPDKICYYRKQTAELVITSAVWLLALAWIINLTHSSLFRRPSISSIMVGVYTLQSV